MLLRKLIIYWGWSKNLSINYLDPDMLVKLLFCYYCPFRFGILQFGIGAIDQRKIERLNIELQD